MQVVILASGEGSRIRPYTDVIPKCLLPVNGIPCIKYIIGELIEQGVDWDDIIVCIEKKFKNHFSDVFLGDITLSVSEEPQGTVGEVVKIPNLEDRFILIYGDDLTKCDYKQLSKCKETTLVLTKNVPLEVGLAQIVGNKIIGFEEKPKINLPIWTGRALIEKKILRGFGKGDDFARDVFNNRTLDYILTDNLWVDVGNYHHYMKANKLAEEGKI